eukprot:GHVN01071755.1.p1 GENE.GHVN01071755.1~~GHVN01071755.1.p1  ORF type:complete len:213 (-),score=21.84 GHVN01071755.1:129-767(-)
MMLIGQHDSAEAFDLYAFMPERQNFFALLDLHSETVRAIPMMVKVLKADGHKENEAKLRTTSCATCTSKETKAQLEQYASPRTPSDPQKTARRLTPLCGLCCLRLSVCDWVWLWGCVCLWVPTSVCICLEEGHMNLKRLTLIFVQGSHQTERDREENNSQRVVTRLAHLSWPLADMQPNNSLSILNLILAHLNSTQLAHLFLPYSPLITSLT